MKIFSAHHILSLLRSSIQVSQEFLKEFWTMDLCWRAYKPWIWFWENQVWIFLQEEKDRPVRWTDQREGTQGPQWIKREGTLEPRWSKREGTQGPFTGEKARGRPHLVPIFRRCFITQVKSPPFLFLWPQISGRLG